MGSLCLLVELHPGGSAINGVPDFMCYYIEDCFSHFINTPLRILTIIRSKKLNRSGNYRKSDYSCSGPDLFLATNALHNITFIYKKYQHLDNFFFI